MEGIVLEIEALASPWGFIAGLSLLVIGAVSALLGYMAEEEKSGRRLFWAEWPIPESGPSPHIEKEFRLAA